MVNYIMRKNLIILTVFSILLSVSSVSAVAPWEIEDLMGKEMPSFSLMDMSGKTVSQDTFRGKVLLINFWATWCAPCKVEMPSLNNLFRRLRDRGLMVLAISVDDSDEAVHKFLKETPLDFPVLRDPQIDVSMKYKVYAYPTTFLVDKRGLIKKNYMGESDWLDDEIVKIIEELIED